MPSIKSAKASANNNLTIADVKLLKPEPGEIILVQVDTTNYSSSQQAVYLENLQRALVGVFPNNHLVILPKGVSIT